MARDEQAQLTGHGWSAVDHDPVGAYRWMTAPEARLVLPIAGPAPTGDPDAGDAGDPGCRGNGATACESNGAARSGPPNRLARVRVVAATRFCSAGDERSGRDRGGPASQSRRERRRERGCCERRTGDALGPLTCAASASVRARSTGRGLVQQVQISYGYTASWRRPFARTGWNSGLQLDCELIACEPAGRERQRRLPLLVRTRPRRRRCSRWRSPSVWRRARPHGRFSVEAPTASVRARGTVTTASARVHRITSCPILWCAVKSALADVPVPVRRRRRSG